MIGIKANGVFWDMKPGASAEIERKSPFFSFDDVPIEYSTPVTFLYSPVNDKGADFYFQYYTERIKKSIAVEFYDGPVFQSRAMLIIESADININAIEESQITGYLLYSLSNFYQQVRDKKLKELKLGGTRNFTFTTSDPTDGSDGYWQHFHDTWSDDTIPYVFAPIRNEKIYGEEGPDFINRLGDNGQLNFDPEDAAPLVPMIRLPYLLTQIYAEHGFTVDFSGLNDEDWKKLYLVNLVKIDWVYIAPTGGDPPAAYTAQPFIKIDLNKHVSQDKTIFDFILQLFRRYGWAPVFSLQKRECRYVSLKELGKGTKKDWTRFASPVLSTTFNQDLKKWAFKTEIDGNDDYPSAPDFTGIKFSPQRLSLQGAPAPSMSMEGRVMYCFDENQWYQVKLNEDSNEFEWMYYADNIYDLEPDGATDTISSSISTLPIQFTKYRSVGPGDDRYCYFPVMEQEATKAIGYRLLFFFGLNYELKDNKGAGDLLIPYSSSIREESFGSTPLAWSNVFRHPLFSGSPVEEDYGIVPYWFQKYLDTMVRGEDTAFDLRLPVTELMNFSWDDVIIINQLGYMVMQLTQPTPYRGKLRATLKRIVKKAAAANGNIRPIYIHLTVFNLNPFSFDMVIPFVGSITVTGVNCDVKLNLYSDPAGTIPYTPVTPLSIMLRATRTDDGIVTFDESQSYIVAESEEVIMTNTLQSSERPIDHTSDIVYALDDSFTGEYVVI
jgi:hypothetical protein